LGLKDNPSPDPAQCGKPTALGTPLTVFHPPLQIIQNLSYILLYHVLIFKIKRVK